MKYLPMIIFFSVFFSVFFGANYYFFIRGFHALPANFIYRRTYVTLFIVLSFSFLLGRLTGNIYEYFPSKAFTWIGSFWLAATLYFFISVVFIDFVRLGNLALHFLPQQGTPEYQKLKLYTLTAVTGIVFLLILIGHINANATRTRKINLVLNKEIPGGKEIKIAVASDIHLGTMIAKRRAEKLVKMLNSQNPDIILLAGDILDGIQESDVKKDVGAPLRKLKAPLGVYAIPGNHEYFGGIKKSLQYINTLGIKVLIDTVVDIDGKFLLIGRDDKDKKRVTGIPRKMLSEIVSSVDLSRITVMMDHQPLKLDSAVKYNIDLQISGHTHRGQMWPFSLLVDKMYELSYGYIQKGNTHFYVSPGFGTWGPPVRIGTVPEVAYITISQKKQ